MKHLALALMMGFFAMASAAMAGDPRELVIAKNAPIFGTVSPKEFLKLSKTEGAVILDVRDASDVKDVLMDKAIALPESEITKETMAKVAPDKTKPLLLICNYSFMPQKNAEMSRTPLPMSAIYQAAGKLLPLGYQKIYGLNYVEGGKDLELLSLQPAKKGHR